MHLLFGQLWAVDPSHLMKPRLLSESCYPQFTDVEAKAQKGYMMCLLLLNCSQDTDLI